MTFNKNHTPPNKSPKITEFCGKKHENNLQETTSMWAQGIIDDQSFRVKSEDGVSTE